MFTVNQIHELLDILNKQNLIFISSKLGINYLTEEEVHKLQSYGINPYHLYKESKDIALMSFHFGMISDAINQKDVKNITIDDLKEYFEKGNHIPLTQTEKNVIDSIKKQYLGDIRANNGKIFQDLNNIISKNEKNNRLAYEKVIRDEVAKGILMKKTSEQIARELAHKTGDWSRNFKRIVDFISHSAWDEGRAAMIEDKYGKDALVFKQVYEGACKYCVKAYLTGGIGSEPKIFKLSQLKANGTNIGRKVDDLKPVIGSHHPHCFDDQTEVLTNQGWKFFKDLNKTEKFFSVNLESGEGEWYSAVNWVNQYYEGDIHHFSHKSFDLATTPNHHHVIKTNKAKHLRLVETKDLPMNSQFLRHLPKWSGLSIESFVFNKRTFKATDFCEFMGFYLSEGCVINYEGRMRIHISQSKEKYYEDIYSVCFRMFGSSTYKCQDYIQVNLSKDDEELFEYLSLGKSFEKSIPQNIKELNIELLSIFLDSFRKGDRTIHKGRKWGEYLCRDNREFSTSSKQLADDLGELILKIGKTPSYSIRPAGNGVYDSRRKKTYYSNHPQYLIRELVSKFSQKSIMKENIIPYKGFIYDVELEKNHTLFVRRNGKVCVSGNCRCTLHFANQKYNWDNKTQAFDTPKISPPKEQIQREGRKPIRIKVRGKEYIV